MIRIFLTLMMLVLPFAAHAQEAKETAYDRVMRTGQIDCGYVVYPPFITMDVNTKKLGGLTVEILEAIGQELNLKVNWKEEVTPTTAFEAIKSDRLDVICVPFWPTGGRMRVSAPTVPLFYAGMYAVVRAGDARFKTYDSMNAEGVTIVTQEGTANQTLVNKGFPKAKKIEEMSMVDPAVLMMDVIAKKADAAFLEMSTFKDFDRLHPGELAVAIDAPYVVEPSHLWLPVGDERLKNMIDGAIGILHNHNEIKKITQKYGGAPSFMPVARGYEGQ